MKKGGFFILNHMSANLWKASTSNAFSTTLNGSITSSDTSIVLTSASGLQAPGVIVVDRVDSNGVATSTTREYISYTGISTNTLTGASRGLGGSTAQAHSSAAKVEEVLSITHWNDLLTALLNVFTSAGALDTTKVADLTTAQTFTNKTLTQPFITNNYIFRGYRNSTQSVNTGSDILVAIDTETYDSNNNFNISTSQYTAPRTGKYLIHGAIALTPETNKFYYPSIYVNGALALYGNTGFPPSNNNIGIQVSGVLSVTAAQTIELRLYNGGASACTVLAGSTSTYLDISYLCE